MYKEVKIVVLGSLLTLILTLSIFTGLDQNSVSTNAEAGVSNKKIGWGIKRKDNHEQPDLGDQNVGLINKYNGIALGNNQNRTIYLTYDLGYEAGYTAKILDTLKEKNVQGTFFITAHYLNTAEDLVKRMIDERHIVGNHSPYALMDMLKSQ